MKQVVLIGICFLAMCAAAQNGTSCTVSGNTISCPTAGMPSNPPQEKFRPEKLTEDELRDLDAARKAAAEANAKLDAVEWAIRWAHGATPYIQNFCGQDLTTVEIRGEWALVTTRPKDSCFTLGN